MIKNFFTVAYRHLVGNKIYSFINIAGLAAGMTVALLIGFWIQDEMNYNKSVAHYDRLGKVWQYVQFGPVKSSYDVIPQPLAKELREKYPEVENSSMNVVKEQIFHYGNQPVTIHGNFVEPVFPSMFSMEMIAGNKNGLNEIHSVMLSQSTAKTIFGDKNPIGSLLRMGDSTPVKVTAVYADFPSNSDFKDLQFLAPWQLFQTIEENAKNSTDQWDNNSYNVYVLLKPGTDFKNFSAKIKDIRMKRTDPPAYKPEFFVHPMSRWHLYDEFYDGKNTGGRITYVWLFGIIGLFVLLLACINFMNLSTARSEKRSKEVGIRKTIGSVRGQLVLQFFSESVLYVICSFMFALILAFLLLPYFNRLAGKEMVINWSNPSFWILSAGFCFFTALIAGSYPAFYLSGFDAVQVLKGTFKAGRFAAVPRKVLVVLQFTVSVFMIVGTVVVFRQIQFVKNRPVGYERNRLVEINMSKALAGHYDALRKDLISAGLAENMSEASGPLTEQSNGTTSVSWSNKKPEDHPLLMSNNISHDYGHTIGWQMKQGRDFSRVFGADTSAMILNESAVQIMGFKNPIGQPVQANGKSYQVVGVTADMIKESPFQQVKPSFYTVNYGGVNTINLRLPEKRSAHEALTGIEKIFRRYDPGTPFNYHFVDQQYAQKFSDQEKTGVLAAVFATLAIAISALGLFGLASFVAEQRTKEIGVRKVLGASVWSIWQLLSREFIVLVTIALLIAIPLSYFAMRQWLQNYEFRAQLSLWIFLSVAAGAILITLLTISFQAIRAALANPVESLRME